MDMKTAALASKTPGKRPLSAALFSAEQQGANKRPTTITTPPPTRMVETVVEQRPPQFEDVTTPTSFENLDELLQLDDDANMDDEWPFPDSSETEAQPQADQNAQEMVVYISSVTEKTDLEDAMAEIRGHLAVKIDFETAEETIIDLLVERNSKTMHASILLDKAVVLRPQWEDIGFKINVDAQQFFKKAVVYNTGVQDTYTMVIKTTNIRIKDLVEGCALQFKKVVVEVSLWFVWSMEKFQGTLIGVTRDAFELLRRKTHIMIGNKMFPLDLLKRGRNGQIIDEFKFMVELNLSHDQGKTRGQARRVIQSLDGGRWTKYFYDRMKFVNILTKNQRLKPLAGKFLMSLRTQEAKDELLHKYPNTFKLPYAERDAKKIVNNLR